MRLCAKMTTETLFSTPFGMHFIHDLAEDYWYLRNGPASGFSGVAILCLDQDRDIILINNHRVPLNRSCIEIPRGGLMEGEIAAHGAIRELFEETGLLISEGDLIDLGTIYPDTGALASEVAIYATNYPGKFSDHEGLRHDPEESLGLMICSFEEFLEMITRNEIRDSFTVAAAGRLMAYEISDPAPATL